VIEKALFWVAESVGDFVLSEVVAAVLAVILVVSTFLVLIVVALEVDMVDIVVRIAGCSCIEQHEVESGRIL